MATKAPLKIKKFLAPTPSGPAGDPVKTLTWSVNRLGYAVADIGQLLVDDLTKQQSTLLNAEADRQRQLEKDRKKEEEYNKNIKGEDVEKGAKQEVKKSGKKWAWLESLLKPLKWLAKAAAGWLILSFLEMPGTRNDLKIGLAVIGGWFKSLYKVTSGSIGLIFDGLAEDSPIMGILKVIGGIGGLWIAGRILRPWKLIGDFKKLKKMVDFLRFGKQGSGKRFAEGRRIIKQRQLKKALRMKKLLRLKRLAKVKGGRFLKSGSKFLKGGLKSAGRFLKGGGMAGLAGIFSFANRLSSGKSLQNAIGGGAGAAIGGIAMGALLTPVLGPFGPIVGQLIGSFLGDKIGAFLGDAFTPMFKPMKRGFAMYFQIFKAFYKPVSDAFVDLWTTGLAPFFDKMKEIFKPLVDSGIEKINNILNSVWVEEAFYSLVSLVNKGRKLMNAGALISPFATDQQKIDARVDNATIDVAESSQKLSTLEKLQEKEGSDFKRWTWRYTVGERIAKEKEYKEKLKQKQNELIIEQIAQENEEVTALLPAKFPLKSGFLDFEVSSVTDKLGLKGGRVVRPSDPTRFPIDVFAVKSGKVRQWGYEKKDNYRKSGMIIEGDGSNPDIGYRNVRPTIDHKKRVKPGDKIGELLDARKFKGTGKNRNKKLTSKSTFLLLQGFTNHKIMNVGDGLLSRGYNKNRQDIADLYPDIFPAPEAEKIITNSVVPEEITSTVTNNGVELKQEKVYKVGDNKVVLQPIVQPSVTTDGDGTTIQHQDNEATVY